MANELIKPIRCDNLKLTTLDAWSDDPTPRFDAVSAKQWIARFDKDSSWPELKRVEVDAQEEVRIDIVIAGSPCPHAGYWYTFAKENSRQYFKQGDIFPDFESDWGMCIGSLMVKSDLYPSGAFFLIKTIIFNFSLTWRCYVKGSK